MGISALGNTVPNFVIGPVLTLIFAVSLAWLPTGSWGSGDFRHLVLPIVVSLWRSSPSSRV